MKVLEERDAFLSDYEVLQFLTHLERKNLWDDDSLAEMKNKKFKKGSKRPYNHPELQAITRGMIAYLSFDKNSIPVEQDEEEEEEKDADGDVDLENSKKSETELKSPLTRMNDEKFSEFIRKLNAYSLYQAEKLQLINQLPTNMVHLYAIIEECESRFNEEEIDQILKIIAEYI
ncbi:hypothetical protein TBLA_0H02480 [Henningerozyma blattae CBS 6284]|uniref:DNA-directed RNA polymerase III subunit RPC9 n=1 Tax=Henningerozyma blattae (strain ATCC 34711 / CBS 6284 / DSM 70876 / NBRC 10599 / NRRL Y-10934 / UCD 77-7) TaxID=1071380 RepID=I2H830_HENB6|nr:hypothetical protein TBLA_0H02480 [Tetrapisispora blattae CBS 6284]CCH62532.1 hypothetical protein TBLA_0H02480 [Tetrapisispora blattae CBS 6284]